MTAFVFRLLGAIVLGVGIAWFVYGVGVQAVTADPAAKFVMEARWPFGLPGAITALTGLFVWGIGSGLSRLNQIARETSYTANKTAAMADALDRLSRGRSVI